MMDASQKETLWSTRHGNIRIRGFCTPQEIRTCRFDSQFGTYAHYKSLYTRRESLEESAGRKDANVVLALDNKKDIIGFGVLAYPDPGDRWSNLGSGKMMEIKALEVCRRWRGGNVAKGVLKKLLSHPEIAAKILYLVGFSWTWDLDGTDQSALAYRNMLIRLYESFGFEEYQTNEPNICLKAENFFMGRIGKTVTPEIITNFKWLRFDIYPNDADPGS
jgi:acetoin utilization protein AcuA